MDISFEQNKYGTVTVAVQCSGCTNYVYRSEQAQFEVPHSEIQVKLDWQLNW